LEAPGPSGDERAAALVWQRYASGFGDATADALGSRYVSAGNGEPTIAVFGHIDEIGLAIVHVDDDGYLWFSAVGGWIPTVLVAQRVRVLTSDGPVVGVIGQKPPHLTEPEERKQAPKLTSLWIDIGAGDGDEARERVGIGDL